MENIETVFHHTRKIKRETAHFTTSNLYRMNHQPEN